MAADTVAFALKNNAGTTLRTFNLPFHKLNASAAPAAGDDDADGYVPGSVWIDTVADTAYVCVDNATGAAVWQEIGGGTTDVAGRIALRI